MNIVLFEGEPLFPRNDERFRHIQKVLRKGVGDSFRAGVIDGAEGTATITRMDECGVSFDFAPERPARPLPPVSVIVGFPRPIQLRRLLRDLAGLGAREVCLTGTELGEKSYRESNLAEPAAIRECLVDGCMQAGGAAIPAARLFGSVAETLAAVCGAASSGAAPVSPGGAGAPAPGAQTVAGEACRVLLDVVDPESSLASADLGAVSEGRPLVLAIGSERGWTAAERAAFRDAGFRVCSLGPRILRTETAATAALAIALAKTGFMEGTK